MKLWITSLLILISMVSHGASFIVRNGEPPETMTQTLNADETGLIEAGGALVPTVGFLGVNMFGPDALLINNGLIEVDIANGVNMGGANNQFINNKTLQATGDNGQAVFINGTTDAVVSNSGLIDNVGDNTAGIDSFSDTNTRIANGGEIAVEGENTVAIRLQSSTNSQVTNNGLLYSVGDASFGIFDQTGSANLYTNNGSIVSQGMNSVGFAVSSSTDVTFQNNSTVIADGDGVISDTGDTNFHLINSGTIKSNQSFALLLGGTNPTLSLLRGSNLQGPVQAVDDSLNLNVQTGLNLALTLDPGGMGFGTLGIESPFVLVGNTINVIDRTGLAMQADLLADLSDPILNNIYRHRTAFSCACYDPCQCGFWVEAIGSYREREERHLVHYNLRQGGFIIGYEAPGGLGLFAGASYGEAIVGEKTQKAEIRTSFGGASYERAFCNHFIGAAFAAGYTHFDNDRYIMNNQVPGGVEKAQTQPDGFFFTPEITYAHSFCDWWCAPVLSGTIRYAGLFLGNDHEQGSNSNLTVYDRDIQLLTLRGELSAPKCTCFLDIEPYIGVSGRFQVAGCDVSAELLGQALNFNSGISNNLATFLVGFRSAKTMGCFDLFFDLEADWDTGGSYRIFGDAGIGLIF
ncbi:MAG: hypothetical protein S4CHLAM2_05030 [Chlamydiales bacterium]|nr:hypothetical protein [Chlamydiales bacterium]